MLSAALAFACASEATVTGSGALAGDGVAAPAVTGIVAIGGVSVSMLVGDDSVDKLRGAVPTGDNSGVVATLVSTKTSVGAGDNSTDGAGVIVEPDWLESGVRVGGDDAGVVGVVAIAVGVSCGSDVGVMERLGVGEGTV